MAASMVTEQDVVSDLLPRRAPGSGGGVYLEGCRLPVSARLHSAPVRTLVGIKAYWLRGATGF